MHTQLYLLFKCPVMGDYKKYSVCACIADLKCVCMFQWTCCDIATS